VNLEGRILLGRFRVEALIARGGMGAVYLARHLDLDMPVAIKVIQRDLGGPGEVLEGARDHLRIRFQREARALARVSSEYVCRPLDFGTLESGEPYLVLEHLVGASLSSVAAQGRMSSSMIADHCAQVAAGLAAVHEQGLVHRDLKPSNIFIAQVQGGRRLAKLVDFGLAKALDIDTLITQGGQLIGTPEFMSPEQVACAPDIDHRADLWALGVVLHWMVTGVPPFRAPSRSQLLKAIMHEEARLDDPAWRAVPLLRDATAACLAKYPAKRPASVAAIVDMIGPLLSEEGAHAARIARARRASSAPVAEDPGHLPSMETTVARGEDRASIPQRPPPPVAKEFRTPRKR